jgi:hypothetical protein
MQLQRNHLKFIHRDLAVGGLIRRLSSIHCGLQVQPAPGVTPVGVFWSSSIRFPTAFALGYVVASLRDFNNRNQIATILAGSLTKRCASDNVIQSYSAGFNESPRPHHKKRRF